MDIVKDWTSCLQFDFFALNNINLNLFGSKSIRIDFESVVYISLTTFRSTVISFKLILFN